MWLVGIVSLSISIICYIIIKVIKKNQTNKLQVMRKIKNYVFNKIIYI